MRIVEVKLFRVDLPLADPFQHASSGLVNSLQEVVASVRTDSGVIGYGEVRGTCSLPRCHSTPSSDTGKAGT